jgi:hypothetical protein
VGLAYPLQGFKNSAALRSVMDRPNSNGSRVAILGWGSLVWDPRQLGIDHEIGWRRGGPEVPLEFSRRSSDGRLTLVIDTDHGVPLSVRYATSTAETLSQAVRNLAEREGTGPKTGVGHLEVATRAGHSRIASVLDTCALWGDSSGYTHIVWTDLPPSESFTLDWAWNYLTSLTGEAERRAREYIVRAPPEIETPLRRLLASRGWLSGQ